MPVDTRDKRSSAIQPMLPWRGQYPAPDGILNQADRQHAALLYRGILAGAPAPEADFDDAYALLTKSARRATLTNTGRTAILTSTVKPEAELEN